MDPFENSSQKEKGEAGVEFPLTSLSPGWRRLLAEDFGHEYFESLTRFVGVEFDSETVFPARDQIFRALKVTDFDDVKVFILGQDPYHGPGQAHGLAFSVQPGVAIPRSLQNIFKELSADIGCPAPTSGSLLPWAGQGVLLLNSVLTVRAGQPNSHKDRGWERFTDAIITRMSARSKPLVFLLWGAYAQKKKSLIDQSRHFLIESVHPSPLSARRGFFGSRPFSRINEFLIRQGQTPVDWCLPAGRTRDLPGIG